MCEKAKEIQKEWQPQEGDKFAFKKDLNKTNFVFQSTLDDVKNTEIIIAVDGLIIEKKSVIWLPYQHQLQEMVCEAKYTRLWWISKFYKPKEKIPIILLFQDFEEFLEKEIFPTKNINYSAEELWLIYVMKRKYNKIWNKIKKEWEEIKNENTKKIN